MKFAYADPPYPGCAELYREHPDYAGEVDHAALIRRLECDYPDGWALSTGAPQLQEVLSLCPHGVGVAIWHRTNAYPPRAGNGWHWCWEPVIVRGGRPKPVRTVLECGYNGSRNRFTGGKPPAFTRWMLALLGAEPEDTIDDLFPGSGAVGKAIESWRRQSVLPTCHVEKRPHPERIARDLRLKGQPDLLSVELSQPEHGGSGPELLECSY